MMEGRERHIVSKKYTEYRRAARIVGRISMTMISPKQETWGK
jgi:hypothetical protein